jgi:hypothetical protein
LTSGGYREDSAAAWLDAEDLRHAATTDIDRASADDLRQLIGGTLAPLARARTLVRLSQFATDANAKFDAEDYAKKAAATLVQSGYLDPAVHAIEAALETWITEICRRSEATGVRPEKALAEIGRMYADIQAARHGLSLVTDSPSAAQIEATFQTLAGAVLQGLAQLSMARDEVAAKLVRYLPQLKTSSPDPAVHFGLNEAAIALSNRLFTIQVEANDAQSGGNPTALHVLLTRAAECFAEAQLLGDDFTVGHACFVKAYVHSFMGAMDLAITAATDGEDALLRGVPATPERYLDRRVFNMLLELRGLRIGALLVLEEDEARLSLAQDCVKLIDARRYQIGDPLQQGAFLTGRTFFYEMCVHAAFRLQRWDDLLAAMELIKARKTLLNRLVPPPTLTDVEIDARLAEVAKLQNETAKGSDAWLAASAQRRLLLNLRAIERRTTALPPPLSINTLQASLATEAAIAWVWVSNNVLIVLAIRQQEICADRIALTPEEVEMLDVHSGSIWPSWRLT